MIWYCLLKIVSNKSIWIDMHQIILWLSAINVIFGSFGYATMSLYDHHLSLSLSLVLSLVLSALLASVSVDSSLSVKDICYYSKISLHRDFVSHKMHLGKRLAIMLAVKRSAGVAPEVNLGECILHLPPQKQANKADPTLALLKPQRRFHQKFKTGVPLALK